MAAVFHHPPIFENNDLACLANGLKPVSNDKPDLRNAQTRFASASVRRMRVRKPSFFFSNNSSRSGTSSLKNSTIKMDSQGCVSSSSKSRAA